MGADRPARRAVFLDRDGVINRNILNPASGEYEAPLTVRHFELLPGASHALQRIQRAGYLLFLVSNQPNFAKGKSTLAEHQAIDRELQRQLIRARVRFAATYYCLHHPDGRVQGLSGPCPCRKPSPYFLLRAARKFGIDLEQSWMVGDRATDILCGRNAGARTIFIAPEKDSFESLFPDRIHVNLAEAAEFICAPQAVFSTRGA
ncbi:MAG TPA: HAD-IIIA family hydrolase [Silvibacterium sp.]|nr:HAD-IIIA family hydrolase [Silvibacterium sp.]